MPAVYFVCPDNRKVPIVSCLNNCPHKERCMFLPTLRSIAISSDRKLSKPSVTELIAGTRETYLKRTTDYAIDPFDSLFALHGQAVHYMNYKKQGDNILGEVRMEDEITTGQFDMFGYVLNDKKLTLGDLKVTSSYKLMKALGIYKKDVPTGEVYKSGAKKGTIKYKKQTSFDGVRHVMDWALQLNYYRMLLEDNGYDVNDMVIQAFCRDFSTRVAMERNIDRPLYIIKINRISDRWLQRYFSYKAQNLKEALNNNDIPPVCTAKERWYDRKCLGFCNVADKCPYAQVLKQQQEKLAM